jgi:hypothetical protein
MMGVARMILVSFSRDLATSRILQKTNRLAHRQEGTVMSHPRQGTLVHRCLAVLPAFDASMGRTWIFDRTHSVGDGKL